MFSSYCQVKKNQYLIAMVFLAAATFFSCVSVQANTNVYEFTKETDRERFQRFTHELRCPKCQSQNLAGSDSSISQDLKKELHRLITEGKSDEQVIDFMVSRYGDFVLYKPKFQPSTYALWLGPIVLLLIGLLIFGFVVYRKSKRQVSTIKQPAVKQ